MRNSGIDNFKFGIVGIKSSVGFDDGLVGDVKEVFEGTDLSDVIGISSESRLDKVFLEVLKESSNFSGSLFVSEILSHFNESFGKMTKRRGTFELGCQFLEMSLSLFDLDE